MTVLTEALIREGFHPYLTSVGGSGLGILSPYPEHRTRGSDPLPPPRHDTAGHVTPPDTPSSEIRAPKHGPFDPLRPTFETASKADITNWASSLGRWLYV